MGRLSNFLFTSLGCLQPDPSYEQLAPHPHKYLLENLRLSEAGFRREGVVGDINYSFFDGQGQTAHDWHIFPALGTSQTQEMVKAGKRVVVAVGKYKPASSMN
jgi:DNA-binding transcriptional regulator LsrR (DeoR family)